MLNVRPIQRTITPPRARGAITAQTRCGVCQAVRSVAAKVVRLAGRAPAANRNRG